MILDLNDPANVVDIASRRPPLGTYFATSCNDAASRERDGKAYMALNHLASASGEAPCEVQCRDGLQDTRFLGWIFLGLDLSGRTGPTHTTDSVSSLSRLWFGHG